MNLTGDNELEGFGLEEILKDQIPDPKPNPIVDITAESLGGDRFDNSGNLIKDGKIIKTKDQVEVEKSKNTKSEEKPFNINGDSNEKPKEDDNEEDEIELKYTLDKDGNLLLNGELYKKKGEFEMNDKGEVSIKESGFVNSLVELATAQGYEFVDESGKPIEFEDSEAGYFAIAKAMAQQDTVNDINQFLDTYPSVKELFSYLQAGKTEADYYASKVQQVDYSKQTLPENESDQEVLLIDMYRKVYNMPEAQAKDLVGLIKDSNNLEQRSKEAIVTLQNWQKETSAKEQQEIADRIKDQQQKELDTLKEINQTVSSGKLGDIQIPENAKKDFYEFLTQQTPNGMTRAAEAYSKLSLDQQLKIEYLIYKNMDIEDLVKIKLRQEKVDLIKNRANKAKPIIISDSNRFQRDSTVTPDLENVN